MTEEIIVTLIISYSISFALSYMFANAGKTLFEFVWGNNDYNIFGKLFFTLMLIVICPLRIIWDLFYSLFTL